MLTKSLRCEHIADENTEHQPAHLGTILNAVKPLNACRVDITSVKQGVGALVNRSTSCKAVNRHWPILADAAHRLALEVIVCRRLDEDHVVRGGEGKPSCCGTRRQETDVHLGVGVLKSFRLA